MNLNRIYLIVCFLVSFAAYSQKDIFEVARSGSVNDVKSLMAINADTINKVEASGYLPLTLACYRGNEDVAVFLAKHTKNINGTSKLGTPLMAAVFKDEVAIVEALLKQNADPNIADGNGTTALHYAIMGRNEAMVKLLVEANANVDFKDKRGNSAIDYGKMTQNETIITLLKKNRL